MVDKRKKVKLTIEVTERDLCNFEDFLYCIPLCDKHKSYSWEEIISERMEMTMYYECKECDKVRNEWATGAQRIHNRLWEQMEKEMKRK